MWTNHIAIQCKRESVWGYSWPRILLVSFVPKKEPSDSTSKNTRPRVISLVTAPHAVTQIPLVDIFKMSSPWKKEIKLNWPIQDQNCVLVFISLHLAKLMWSHRPALIIRVLKHWLALFPTSSLQLLASYLMSGAQSVLRADIQFLFRKFRTFVESDWSTKSDFHVDEKETDHPCYVEVFLQSHGKGTEETLNVFFSKQVLCSNTNVIVAAADHQG